MLMISIKNLLAAFVPLFVAVDAIGVLPMFVSLTADLDTDKRNKVLSQSVVTASCLALGFVFVGKAVFGLLGITIGDFMIAGGAILFCFSIIDLLHSEKERRQPGENLGAVPLGTPLIAGPAVLTTSMICVSQYGLTATVVSVLVNIMLAGVLFYYASGLLKLIGDTGSKALSKIMSLLLAAIAVMLIRRGLQQFLQ